MKPLNLQPSKSPEPKKSPRAATSSQRRPKFIGILGLDSIRDEENKLGSYKTVVEGGKMVLQREFTYGLNEKHYTSEAERDKNKSKFYSFMKQMDLQIKLTDNHLAEMKAIKMNKTQAINQFMRKSTQQMYDEKPNEVNLEQAIDAIIKKQS